MIIIQRCHVILAAARKAHGAGRGRKVALITGKWRMKGEAEDGTWKLLKSFSTPPDFNTRTCLLGNLT